MTMTQSVILLVWIAKATAVLLVAAGLTLALRRAPAGARYVVWLATLVTLLLIPAVSSWSPIRVRVLPAETPSAVRSNVTTAPPTLTGAPAAAAPAQALASARLAPSTRQAVVSPTYSALTISLAIWVAIVAAVLAWLLLGAFAVHRIVSRAVVLDGDSWLHPMYDVADRLGLENAPRVVMSSVIEMPFACGVLRPTIVLPKSADQWSDERRRCVLFHELAHIRRRDLIGHTLGRLACALY
jgi:beta-lactamase regulating signal transducer with metallopeptidase domain